GSYIKLEKAGSNYKARCPFHNEKTPSFFVSPSRNSFYCFGCQAKGDIFSFVEQFEGLDFVGALKVLAGRAGVELVRENPAAKSEKDRLYRVLDVTTEFFEKSLISDAEAKSYLEKRGVKEGTIKDWRLGFAPDDWRALHDELIKRGFKTDEMLKAGLVKKSETGTGFYDIFRGRIMFPIFDSSDRVIGFSGRLLPRLDDGKMGKYINSPETILFNKSRVLYGLHKAKFDIRKRDYSIVVEGQMDLIMSHQAGFTNTVAVSGTALTGHEVSENRKPDFLMKAGGFTETINVSVVKDAIGILKRLSDNVKFAFDSDDAGFRAAQKAAIAALQLGMDVKMAEIKGGKDAADIILETPAKWAEIIKNSKHVIDFSLETLLEKKLEPRKLGKEIVTLVLPYVKALQSAVDQSHFITKIFQVTKIKEEALWSELKQIASFIGEGQPEATERPALSRDSKFNWQNSIERKILSVLYWQEGKTKPTVSIVDIR
ncbi:MAG: DNA primase, partial [Candidatus Liptonbacteria bacterium]|nr:DNA primase [Candidatus Liptonbacteria bacterium]